MKFVIGVSALGILSMTAVLIYGFVAGNFWLDGGALMQNPWGIVSLVDLYTGFVLFSGWIVYRENSIINSSIWVVLMMVLGFFTASLYVFLVANASAGDWKKFWMGKNADE